jgi:hypothetical protein
VATLSAEGYSILVDFTRNDCDLDGDTTYELKVIAFCNSLSSFCGSGSEWVQEFAAPRSTKPESELRRYDLPDSSAAGKFANLGCSSGVKCSPCYGSCSW